MHCRSKRNGVKAILKLPTIALTPRLYVVCGRGASFRVLGFGGVVSNGA